MKKILWLTTLVIPLLAFTPKSKKSFSVYFFGSLRDVKSGDLSPKVDLDTVALNSHSFGVGISADNSGELLIWKGKIYNSVAQEDRIETQKVKKPKATFLIRSTVTKWDKYILPSTIRSTKDLEAQIEKIISERGIDSTGLIPIILEGSPISTNWYVLPPPGSNKTISDYAGFFFENKIRAFGFYTNSKQGILTFNQSKLHIHVTNRKKAVIGHLDDIKMAGSMRLWLPKAPEPKRKPRIKR